MAFDPVSLLLEVGGKVLDRVWPDPAQAAQAKIELAKMAQSGELAKITNETEQVKAYLADAQSARARDVEFLKAGRKNIRADVLAYAAIGSLILCIFLLFVADVP